jgi:hypothetical protein
VERLERASARTNDVEARKARRILGLAGKAGPEVEGLPRGVAHSCRSGPKRGSPSLPPSRKMNRFRSPRRWPEPLDRAPPGSA